MGKNNKALHQQARRPAAQAGQATPCGDPGPWPFEPPPARGRGPAERWRDLEAGAHRGDTYDLGRLAARMVHDDPVGGPLVAEQLLVSYVGQLWPRGGNQSK